MYSMYKERNLLFNKAYNIYISNLNNLLFNKAYNIYISNHNNLLFNKANKNLHIYTV